MEILPDVLKDIINVYVYESNYQDVVDQIEDCINHKYYTDKFCCQYDLFKRNIRQSKMFGNFKINNKDKSKTISWTGYSDYMVDSELLFR